MTDPLIGTSLGNYRIITELGGGAMGQVYYAEHQRIGRRAAIKILRKELASAPDMVGRFVHEARAVNDIRHPNIVEITDFGETENGLHYIIMELLEGETLEERIERVGQMQESIAVGVLTQVAAALGAAHERGIVHRDLKPENIYLTNHRDYPDFVKVLDFGIAKLVGDAPKLYMTQAGTVLGTPYYMSPEQCIGEAHIDQRSDVYSLGIVFYEMVTGAVPFGADSIGRLILAHLQEAPVAPRDRNPKLSQQINDVILRMLQKDPKDRYDNMHQVRIALEPPSSLPQPVRIAVRPSPVVPQPQAPSAPRPSPAQAVAAMAATEPPPSEAPSIPLLETQVRPVNNLLTRIVMERLAKNNLNIPPMPKCALDALELLRSSNRKFSDVAGVLEKDPILTAQIFRVANSAVFGTRRATTLDNAVARLGSRQLEMILVQASAHQLYKSPDRRIRDTYEKIWEHCQTVAFLARKLATLVKCEVAADEAYLAGLLHDVGKPVFGGLLLDAQRQVGEQGWVDHAAWLQIVNTSHRDVGVALAMAWKLPSGVVKAIRASDEFELESGRSCSNVVCFANVVAKQTGHYVGDADPLILDSLLGQGRRVLDIDDETFEALLASLEERAQLSESSVNVIEPPDNRPGAKKQRG